MTRMASAVVAVVLSSAAAARADTVVSHYFEGNVGQNPVVLLDSVPPGGFVLTDFIYEAGTGGRILLREDTGGQQTTKAAVRGPDGTVRFVEYHLNSGIAFEAGASIEIVLIAADTPAWITLSGYIPAGTGAVPAIGVWGLAIMVLLIVGAGSVVFRRMRVAA